MAMRRAQVMPSRKLNPRARIERIMKSVAADVTGASKPIRLAQDVAEYTLQLLDTYAAEFLRGAGDATRDVRHTVTTNGDDVRYGILAANRVCGPRWSGAILSAPTLNAAH
jgi:histone H3/H4